ncbi:MAG: hypothetical protein V1929_12825 [bacterium]
MLSQQGFLRRSLGHVSFWAVVSICFLALGCVLGQPRVRPYLLEILLLTLTACLTFLAAAGVYIFVKPVKRSETPKTIACACAVALFLVALFFIGKWISMV